MTSLHMKRTHKHAGLEVTLHDTPEGGLSTDPNTEGLFLRMADSVSAGMGKPTNILIWLVAVIAWNVLFAFGGAHVDSGTWLPSWFTSQGYNFPLNLVTTVAELFIGFLVAAASNRSERNLEATLGRIEQMEDALTKLVEANTDLTEQIHTLVGGKKAG